MLQLILVGSRILGAAGGQAKSHVEAAWANQLKVT